MISRGWARSLHFALKRSRTVVSPAVLPWSYAAFLLENAREMALVEKTCLGGDFRKQLVGVLQKRTRGIDSRKVDIARGRHAERRRKNAFESACRHASQCDKLFKPNILRIMSGDMVCYAPHLPVTVKGVIFARLGKAINAHYADEPPRSVLKRIDVRYHEARRKVGGIFGDTSDDRLAGSHDFLIERHICLGVG